MAVKVSRRTDEELTPIPPEYGDLLEVLGDVPLEEAGFCDTHGSEHSGGKTYRHWELEVAEPVLHRLGYDIIYWATGDGDSFGPLTRYVVTDRGKFLYG